MRITAEKPKDIVELPALTCDQCLGEDIPHPLPRNSGFFLTILGSPGAGKTSMAVSLLTSKKKRVYFKRFHHVYLFIPRNSLQSLKKNIIKDHDKIYDELNLDNLMSVYEAVQKNSAEEEHSLIVFDDMQSSYKDRFCFPTLQKIIMNRRHLRTSIISLAQTLNMTPLSIRKAMSHIIAYPFTNKKQYQNLFEESIPLEKHEADAVIRFCHQKPHDHLFIDVYNQKMYRNFGEIHIERPDN